VSAQPIKKLTLPAGQAFGLQSGLGPLEHGPLGSMRRILGPRLTLPIALPAPFLWELHLAAFDGAPLVHLTLDGDSAPLILRLPAGQRTEALGAVHPSPGRQIRRLSFTLAPDLPETQIFFLALSLLPLGALLP
jgi:hypothetical protein